MMLGKPQVYVQLPRMICNNLYISAYQHFEAAEVLYVNFGGFRASSPNFVVILFNMKKLKNWYAHIVRCTWSKLNSVCLLSFVTYYF